MPVYEYQVVAKGCEFCQGRFEVKQGIKDEPLKSCPECGAAVKRLISLPTVVTERPMTDRERFVHKAAFDARERVSGNIPPD